MFLESKSSESRREFVGIRRELGRMHNLKIFIWVFLESLL